MQRSAWAVFLVAASAGGAGCLDAPSGTTAADCPALPYGTVEHPPIWPQTFNAGEPSDFLYLANSSAVGPTTLVVNLTDNSLEQTQGYGEGLPLPMEDVRFTPPLGTRHFGAFRLSPDVVAQGGVANLHLHDPTRPSECSLAGGLGSGWVARGAVDGEAASPGQGAHVWYAGFWENGTLFDTNLQDLDIGSGWPKAGWYEGGHWDPIPVYVYDQDRSEQPAHWKSPFSGTPAAGSPADEQLGAGYFTTIKGFNEAVKGLPVGTRQVFHLAPEDAYTQPGREDHLLYGDALVFLVEVQDVVDVPCPNPPSAQGTCASFVQRAPPLVT